MNNITRHAEILLTEAFEELDLPNNGLSNSYRQITFRELALQHLFATHPTRSLPLDELSEISDLATQLAASFSARYATEAWSGASLVQQAGHQRGIGYYYAALLQLPARASEDVLLKALMLTGEDAGQWEHLARDLGYRVQEEVESGVVGVDLADAIAKLTVGKRSKGKWVCPVPDDSSDKWCGEWYFTKGELGRHQLEAHGMDELYCHM